MDLFNLYSPQHTKKMGSGVDFLILTIIPNPKNNVGVQMLLAVDLEHFCLTWYLLSEANSHYIY